MASARTNKGKMEGRATTIPYVNHISACHVKTRDQIHGVGWLFSGCMNNGDFFAFCCLKMVCYYMIHFLPYPRNVGKASVHTWEKLRIQSEIYRARLKGSGQVW